MKKVLCLLCFALCAGTSAFSLELPDIEKQYLKIFPEAGSVGLVDYKDGRYYPA